MELDADLVCATRWHLDCDVVVGRVLLMRAAMGLIGLGLVGGVVPTGLAGIPHAWPVLAGTAGALLSLVVCCLGGAIAARRAASAATPAAPRRLRNPIASPQSASRSI